MQFNSPAQASDTEWGLGKHSIKVVECRQSGGISCYRKEEFTWHRAAVFSGSPAVLITCSWHGAAVFSGSPVVLIRWSWHRAAAFSDSPMVLITCSWHRAAVFSGIPTVLITRSWHRAAVFSGSPAVLITRSFSLYQMCQLRSYSCCTALPQLLNY